MTQQYYANDDLPEFNEEYYNANAGGMINNNNGVADKLLQNNELYNNLKGDWSMTMTQPDKNFEWKIGKQDGKLYVERTQHNVEDIKRRCKEYRAWAEAGFEDVLGPITDDGKFAYRWMDLPKVIAQQIQDDYFGGMHWEIIKRDRTTKAQFYQIVESEYPEFICYPGGRLPLPIRPRIPSKKGGTRTVYGAK
jgi:hypothetical protein